MASITTILNAIAPQFSSVDSGVVNVFINIAKERTSSEIFNDNYNLAIALRVAHILTLRENATSGHGGSTGSIKSKKEGDQSISFSESGSGVNSDLESTSYGIQLMGLIDGSVAPISVAGYGNMSQ
jgi:hypothetical protein